jgi:M6 family metalloprotease-like protein
VSGLRGRETLPCVRRSALLLAFALATLAPPAAAVIVWEGKIVQRWPEQPTPALAEVKDINLYPSPKGEVWGLTLLVDFSDQSPAFTKAEVEEWLNQTGFQGSGCNGSVRDYFSDVSQGAVDFQNDVFGFYRAAQPKSYYEGGSGYERAAELLDEVLEYFDDEVDFSKYDNDGDGDTEAISIVYAGFGAQWGQGLWPHAGGLNEQRDGVELGRYMMSDLKDSFGLYTFCHEVGHMLFGWPDLYGFGNYCIMGNAGDAQNPPGINDLYRADQGWIPIVDVDADTNAVFEAVPDGAGYRYQNPHRSEEAFFWSNVQSSGRFDSIDGDGLLLLHFDKAIGNNDPPDPLSLAVVQADGKKELDVTMWPEPGSDAADYFHAAGVAEFSAATHATASFNDGSESGLRIYDIGPIASAMKFTVGTGTPVSEAGAGGQASGGGGAGGAPSGGTSAGTPSGGVAGAVAGAGSVASAGAAGAAGRESAGASTPEREVQGSCACRSQPRRGSPARLALGLMGALVLCFCRRKRANARALPAEVAEVTGNGG